MQNTEQVLREVFGYSELSINLFKDIMEATTITLDPFFLGLEYSKTPYTAEERMQIVATLQLLVAQQFKNVTRPDYVHEEMPTYTASGGAPGVGKTYALEKTFDINVAQGKFPKNAIYIGPDSVVLPQMDVYLRDCADPSIGPLKAYEKWRAASNFIANFMLVKAIADDDVNIVHDTTATSLKMRAILDTLGNRGYFRSIHFYFADKAAREAALEHRKQQLGYMVALNLDHVTAKSESKAEAAYERITDGTYWDRVDSIDFYAQQGEFYLGSGNTVRFAHYNRNMKQFSILPDGEECVEHILDEIDKHENLKLELQTAVHAFFKLNKHEKIVRALPRFTLA